MIMPSFTTLPESMLGPGAIQQKFNAPVFAGLAALRGMGCDCSEYDSEGLCVDPDPCSTVPTTDPSPVSGSPALPSCLGVSLPCGFTGPINCDSSGGGPFYEPCPGGTTPGLPTATPGTTGQGLTPAQQLALDQSILAAGSNLSKIIAAGATGTTVLPNGTVISRGATTAGLVAGAGSTTVLIAIAVLFGVMFLGKGNK